MIPEWMIEIMDKAQADHDSLPEWARPIITEPTEPVYGDDEEEE